MTYELIVEIVEKYPGTFRVLVIEWYEGQKSVFDIIETTAPWLWFNKNKYFTNEGDVEVSFDKRHENTDFGRAKTLASKMKKICEQL